MSTRSVLDPFGVLSPMKLKRSMLCVFRTSRVSSLSLSLEPVRTILCVLRVARVVPRTIPGAIDAELRVICVLQEGKKHKKEKKDKKKHKTEDKSKAKPEGRKDEKREERKEEAKPQKKKMTEERKEKERRTQRGSRGGSWWRTIFQKRCRR